MKKLLSAILALLSFSACAQKSDTIPTPSGKTIIITPIKHGSLRIAFGDKEIQVDPVTDLKPRTDYSKFKKADLILITHEHHDHLDAAAIATLSKPGTTILAPEAVAKSLPSCTTMMNGESKDLSFVKVEAVPAYNNSPNKTKFHPKGHGNGYVLSLDGLRIYIAGDTEDIPEMASLNDIDVAFLPCNLPYTMTPEQVANAARSFKPRIIYPYHFADTKINRVAELLKDSGIEVRIRNFQ